MTLGLSSLQFGIITALAGVGGLIGATTTTGAGGRRLGTGGAIIAAHTVSTVGVGGMVFASLGTHGWGVAPSWARGRLHGFGIGNSHEMSYRPALTPDGLQARTNTTLRSFNRAVIVVVAPLRRPVGRSRGHAPSTHPRVRHLRRHRRPARHLTNYSSGMPTNNPVTRTSE